MFGCFGDAHEGVLVVGMLFGSSKSSLYGGLARASLNFFDRKDW